MKLAIILIAAALAGCATTVDDDYCVSLRIEQDWAGLRQVCEEWSIGHPKTPTQPEFPRMERSAP